VISSSTDEGGDGGGVEALEVHGYVLWAAWAFLGFI
jgi:hypothetical protein